MDLPKSNPSPKRVLIRPPPIPQPDPSPPPPSPPPLAPLNGVVVVGFIGRRMQDVGQLINRVIDANVFGSGNFDREFGFATGEVSEELKDWLQCRKISYYYEDITGTLYLQFCSVRCPVMEGLSEVQLGFDSVLAEREFGDLQGMLFMFSVCHIIIFINEGSHFDTQILKKFRVLQAAKHAMAPFVKSRTTPPLPSRSHSSSSSSSSSSRALSSNRSPGKSGGILTRNGSSISLMSGLGPYTSLFPGQCTPVMLFIFLDDFLDLNPDPNPEESGPSLPMKGSGSVVMLSRPVNKLEDGTRKKLQSSLDAQIRFSIKKCRTLSGPETGHSGPRTGGLSGISSSAPLFSLDASKAVQLVDRSSNQRGESLEFATDLVENILNGMGSSDSLLLESHNQSSNKEDILSIKEFIYKQSDILRGRGGMVGNTSSSSAVGMVAVAAAAAAASVAPRKTVNTPELPSLETWLTSSQLILHGIINAKRGSTDEHEIGKRKSSRVTDPLELAISCLESGRGLNSKFSTLWCQRALPVAKDVYLNELPACYPTSLHVGHLEKALSAFRSMVRGPAVELYLKKLEDECTSIWSSGRQLCDAVSLTGKPCMHQRHDLETGPHSSGFVFLHACACGRLRRLCSDPFDFETANVTSSCYPECDRLLSSLQLPQGSNKSGPIQPSSWSLIRIGGAKYYKPSKGLLQSGFCATQKFLSKCTIFLEKRKEPIDIPSSTHEVDFPRLSSGSKIESKRAGLGQFYRGEMPKEEEFHGSEKVNSDNKKIDFGQPIPNFAMRKPFSEVVAGSAAGDSGFPPLQSKKPTLLTSGKGIKQNSDVGRRAEQVHESNGYQGSQNVEYAPAVNENVNENGSGDGNNSFLQIGRNLIPVGTNSSGNLIPVGTNSSEKTELPTSVKHAFVYVGYEHECPCGHRFILTPEHLNELGAPYAANKESHLQKVAEPSKLGKNGGHGKSHRHTNGMININTPNKDRNTGKSKEIMTNFSHGDSMKDVEASLESISVEDGGITSFSLLNRSLPVYMNCPHCRTSKDKKDLPNVKFASTISQLQRIFLVTPAFPVLLATCPIIQFEASCLPPSVLDREQKLQFALGCRVILPPDSFLSLRLPFVYGVQLEDGSQHPLRPFESQPELTAWITKNTTLQVLSKGSNPDEKFPT